LKKNGQKSRYRSICVNWVNQLSFKNLAYIRMLINFLALFGNNANAKFNKPNCNPERRSKRIKEPEVKGQKSYA